MGTLRGAALRRVGLVPVAVVIAAALAACGAGGTGSVHFPKDFGVPSDGDTATFVFPDGGTDTVTQSGRIELSGAASPALDYSGPLGCRGHYFTTDYSDHIGIYFRYSAVDAVLAIGGDVFHFATAPIVRGTELSWDGTFTGGDHYGVRVHCPLPTDAPEPLVPPR
jgi:hypothetical protein